MNGPDRRAAEQRAEFDRYTRRVVRWAIAGWVFGGLISLGMLGLIVWAVIRLVTHFTS